MVKGPNIFKISCWDLNRRIEGLMTDSQNRVVLERDVLPIIFVPGIMGSRLGRSQQKRVWDPDDKWFMFTHYGRRKADAALKKSFLIGNRFDEDFLQVLNEDAKGHSQIYSLNDKKRKNRKWGGVCWSSYGSFLEKLQNRNWDKAVNLFYEFPVHCFGYNWTASNRRSGKQLASYVEEVIKSYTDKNRKCEKVILVTHSMGGLVARAACKLDGAEANVLATIHGVLPTNGSPAAFWRMKAGFERPHNIPDLEPMQWFRNPGKASGYVAKKALAEVTGYITSWVLGTDGEEVTALLANMPGGLQLLPNRYYKDNVGSERWLEVVDAAGKQMTLPVTDPYDEIYRKKGVYYRLVKPEWLNPGSELSEIEFKKSDWNLYITNLSEAEKFHDDLYDKYQIEPYHHPETYQFYSTGIASADRVVFTRSEDSLWQSAKRILSSITEDIPTDIDGVGKALIFTVAGIGMPLAKKLVEVAIDLAGGAILRDSDWSANRGGYRDRVDEADAPDKQGLNLVMMQLPSGSGDGTVPDSSARALKLGEDTKRTFSIGEDPGFVADLGNGKGGHRPDFHEAYFDRAHEPVFDARSAQFITIASIENICRKEITKRLRVDNKAGVVPL